MAEDSAVVQWIPVARKNPYQALLARALAAQGARAVPLERLRLRAVISALDARRVLHIHWFEFIIRSNAHGRGAAVGVAIRAVRFLAIIAVARWRGVRLVWTVHNLVPHESRHPRLDRAVARAMGRLAHTVTAHSRYAAEQISREYGCRDVVVAHHGNYIGCYPPTPRSREAIRESLGIPSDAHVVLAFGLVRPYKRVPDLIEAFRSIDRSDFRLLIVGEPTVPEEGRDVEAAAAGDPRIILILERVPDDRVRELYDAADVAALAYRDVFSSSALLLALSCCVPVIAPENSTASELAPPPAVQPYRPGDLAGALVRSAGMPESARDSALRAAQRYEWDELACAVLHGHGGSLD